MGDQQVGVWNRFLTMLRGGAARSSSPIDEVLEKRLVKSVFQPVVDLRTRKVFAYEALARSLSPHFNNPIALFSAAIDAGRVGELGRLTRMLSVDGCTEWPLLVNINPNEFDEGWLVRPDDPFYWHDHDIYMEITESVPLSHFELCHSVIAEMRSKGVMLAVDDLGAGFSNLKYIADLSPDLVKLDRDLVAGVTCNSRQHTLVKSIVSLCSQMGAKVVAEGIETADELSAVIDAGVDFGQGYLLARPDYPPPLPAWPEGIEPLSSVA